MDNFILLFCSLQLSETAKMNRTLFACIVLVAAAGFGLLEPHVDIRVLIHLESLKLLSIELSILIFTGTLMLYLYYFKGFDSVPVFPLFLSFAFSPSQPRARAQLDQPPSQPQPCIAPRLKLWRRPPKPQQTDPVSRLAPRPPQPRKPLLLLPPKKKRHCP